MKYSKLRIGNWKLEIGHSRKGQTLVFLLVFMSIAVVVISAAVIVTGINSTSSSQLDSGSIAYDIAESGAENALMRLLRDPSYAGERLTVGNGTADITVTGGLVQSIGHNGKFTRTLQINTSFVNNVLTINSWKEIF